MTEAGPFRMLLRGTPSDSNRASAKRDRRLFNPAVDFASSTAAQSRTGRFFKTSLSSVAASVRTIGLRADPLPSVDFTSSKNRVADRGT